MNNRGFDKEDADFESQVSDGAVIFAIACGMALMLVTAAIIMGFV